MPASVDLRLVVAQYVPTKSKRAKELVRSTRAKKVALKERESS